MKKTIKAIGKTISKKQKAKVIGGDEGTVEKRRARKKI
tara:strand:+ start:58883 stop:58996 length:114 start_codon:yes stop_codon:yes gene_type:complete